MDWVIKEAHDSITRVLREMTRKELKKSSKKELIEFILDNVDLLRKKEI